MLQGKGSVSNAKMEKIVDAVYAQFNERRKKEASFEADQEDTRLLEKMNKQIQELS